MPPLRDFTVARYKRQANVESACAASIELELNADFRILTVTNFV